MRDYALHRLLFATLTLGAIAGCASYSPCATEQQHVAPAPPLACKIDGCTLAPDFDFAECCNRHDEQYWQGGEQQARLNADRQLRQCIAGRGHAVLPSIYYVGVRLGGTPLLPTPWRWGFGWPYLHGYQK